MESLEDHLAGISGGSVLDIATGSGQFIDILTKLLVSFERCLGVDSSEKALARARTCFSDGRITFEQMDGGKLSFGDNSFDTVAIANSLHHFADPGLVLVEMKRVCRPDGVVLVSEMVCDGQSEAQMTHVLLHHWWAAIDTLGGIVHRETYTRAQLRSLFDPLAFRTLDFFGWDEDDSDPRDPERLLQLHGIIDDYLAKIGAGNQTEPLRETGARLHERLETVGIQRATALLVVARQ